MNSVPLVAMVLAIAVLLVVWLFLAHMIASRKDDARLQFLLSLTDPPHADLGHPDPAIPRPAASMLGTRTTKGVEPEADDVGAHAESPRTFAAWQELPVVLAAALRSRAL